MKQNKWGGPVKKAMTVRFDDERDYKRLKHFLVDAELSFQDFAMALIMKELARLEDMKLAPKE